MDEASARKAVAGGSKLWALPLAALAVVAVVAPFLLDADAFGMMFGLVVGGAFGVAALAVASDATPDGHPIRRAG
ncbi:hypothetical protein [Candidatus Halobonum tyrrellensis]|uniref:Uncharacterized protein n=1 Tax=Candidatus Halobonum tyrrellensis G22 TaxID=1324957 RepID=V4HHN4_9EURY|nr:hypothetical protein [Candidatus Halobonum tyrrellensis]ESP87404.1 hypothetical protein K933_14053 [Candidatus Halobonum tyrrellensis G22]